jgi:hypothetical protein
VDVLDLEVAGGVVDERLPRAELRVIALVAGAVGGWLDALHDAVGAMMSSSRVASRSWNPWLKRSMTSSVVLVMIAVPSWLWSGSDLAASVDTLSPEAGSRSVVAGLDPTTAPILSVVVCRLSVGGT